MYKHYKYKPIHETVKLNSTVVTLLNIPQYAKIKNKLKKKNWQWQFTPDGTNLLQPQMYLPKT